MDLKWTEAELEWLEKNRDEIEKSKVQGKISKKALDSALSLYVNRRLLCIYQAEVDSTKFEIVYGTRTIAYSAWVKFNMDLGFTIFQVEKLFFPENFNKEKLTKTLFKDLCKGLEKYGYAEILGSYGININQIKAHWEYRP